MATKEKSPSIGSKTKKGKASVPTATTPTVHSDGREVIVLVGRTPPNSKSTTEGEPTLKEVEEIFQEQILNTELVFSKEIDVYHKNFKRLMRSAPMSSISQEFEHQLEAYTRVSMMIAQDLKASSEEEKETLKRGRPPSLVETQQSGLKTIYGMEDSVNHVSFQKSNFWRAQFHKRFPRSQSTKTAKEIHLRQEQFYVDQEIFMQVSRMTAIHEKEKSKFTHSTVQMQLSMLGFPNVGMEGRHEARAEILSKRSQLLVEEQTNLGLFPEEEVLIEIRSSATVLTSESPQTPKQIQQSQMSDDAKYAKFLAEKYPDSPDFVDELLKGREGAKKGDKQSPPSIVSGYHQLQYTIDSDQTPSQQEQNPLSEKEKPPAQTPKPSTEKAKKPDQSTQPPPPPRQGIPFSRIPGSWAAST